MLVKLHSVYTRILNSIVVAAVVVTTLIPLGKVYAQSADNGFNLSVTPLPTALETKPGVPIKTDLKVRNGSVKTERVKLTVLKFSSVGEDGTPKLEDVTPADEFIKWVTFSEDHFDAEPNVWKTVVMTISPSASAAFAYYYAVVFSPDKPAPTPEQGKSSLVGAVASLVLLGVDAPGSKRQANIKEFSMPRTSYEFLPTEFTVRVENTGNIHVSPVGNIFISKGGKAVSTIDINKAGGYILPGTTRKFLASWSDGSPVYKVVNADGKVVLDKNSKPKTELSWNNFSLSKLRFGKYTAHVTMVYNDGKNDAPLDGDISFWVIPWRILGVLALVLLFLLAGAYAIVIRPLKNRIKNYKK